jgi:glycosyltransferase involved in cell wall biosynthesis
MKLRDRILDRHSGEQAVEDGSLGLLLVNTPPLFAQWFLRGQLQYMRDAGFEVTVVTAPGPGLLETCHPEGATPIGVPIVREISLLKDLLSLWRLCSVMRRVRPVISNVGTPKAGLLGGIAAWLTCVPCRIYTMHTLRFETTRGLKRRVLLLTERLACSLAHRVICDSESLRQRAVEMGIVSADRATALASGSANGVNTKLFAPSADLLRKASLLRHQLGFGVNDPILGFVGRITRDKGIPELLAAFDNLRQEFPELQLLLVGDYEDGDPIAPALRHRIETDLHIVRTGFVRNPEVYYQMMNVLALPSYREGFGNAVLEASAIGRPVVATRATGLIDAVVDGITGFLVPIGDSTALAGSVSRLIKEPHLANRMGEAGRARAVREFAQESVWQALLHEYLSLLRQKGFLIPVSANKKLAQATRDVAKQAAS